METMTQWQLDNLIANLNSGIALLEAREQTERVRRVLNTAKDRRYEAQREAERRYFAKEGR